MLTNQVQKHLEGFFPGHRLLARRLPHHRLSRTRKMTVDAIEIGRFRWIALGKSFSYRKIIESTEDIVMGWLYLSNNERCGHTICFADCFHMPPWVLDLELQVWWVDAG